jgi:hypothetical protein
MLHAYTKHVEIDYHFVRERVASHQLLIRFLCSKDHILNIMTKPLTEPRFDLLQLKLTVNPAPSTCGGCQAITGHLQYTSTAKVASYWLTIISKYLTVPASTSRLLHHAYLSILSLLITVIRVSLLILFIYKMIYCKHFSRRMIFRQ